MGQSHITMVKGSLLTYCYFPCNQRHNLANNTGGGGKIDHGYYELYEAVKLERGEQLI